MYIRFLDPSRGCPSGIANRSGGENDHKIICTLTADLCSAIGNDVGEERARVCGYLQVLCMSQACHRLLSKLIKGFECAHL